MAEKATEAQLIRMLIEMALLRSGYSDEKLAPSDPLILATARCERWKHRGTLSALKTGATNTAKRVRS
jgi:hypothetical protein